MFLNVWDSVAVDRQFLTDGFLAFHILDNFLFIFLLPLVSFEFSLQNRAWPPQSKLNEEASYDTPEMDADEQSQFASHVCAVCATSSAASSFFKRSGSLHRWFPTPTLAKFK